MRLLFVANTPRDPHKGASGCDIATIEALRALGHEVDEIWGPDMARHIGHNNLYQLLELPRRFANAVAAKCRERTYDVIQVNECHAWLAAKEHRRFRRSGVFINRSHGWEPCGRRALWTFADSMDAGRPRWRRACSRVLAMALERHNEKVLRYSHGVVVCSEDDRAYILGEHPDLGERILALAPGTPQDFLDAPLVPMSTERSQRILHVGQFHAAKGPEVICAVVRQVLAACSAAHFTWVCDAVHHTAARTLLGSQCADRVDFLGWMPRRDLMAVYDRHGIFLFPSYTEGFSLTFLEAMARGLCVIASDINGMKQVITDRHDGFLFPRGRPVEMATVIETLLGSPAVESISRRSAATATKYTWRTAAEMLVEFYEMILRQRLQSAETCPLPMAR